MKVPSLPPKILGSMKDPTTGTKINTVPAEIPGKERGMISFHSIIILPAPSDRAAATSVSSIAWSET